LWVYATIPTVIIIIIINIIGGFGNLFLALAKEMLCGETGRSNKAYPRMEDQIQYSCMAPNQ